MNLRSLANIGHWPTIRIEFLHRTNMRENLYFLLVTDCKRVLKIYVQENIII